MLRTLLLSCCAVASALRVGVPATAAPPRRATQMQLTSNGSKRLLVIGGTGFVGAEVCKNAVSAGYSVTALSRRGQNPDPKNELLQQVEWCAGDALDAKSVNAYVSKADAVVHAIGLLFDVDSGLVGLNNVVSGSKSKPGDSSTYDNITRKTAFTMIDALEKRPALPFVSEKIPFAFVSCAEAGWPDVQFGETVDAAAPEWLQRYLVAKRAVEARLGRSDRLRPVIMRPSLIWTWTKLDVLPVIPVFNLACAIGVPFVDKTVRVEDLARATVAGLRDPEVSGVQRYPQMEELSKKFIQELA